MLSRATIVQVGIVVSMAAAGGALAQDVAYEKYKLGNGMTVILHENHGVQRAAVNIWYRVGSKEERTGRSGFAHLFEHLMFMGTQRVPKNTLDTIIESGGGDLNAFTDFDVTDYVSSGPSQLLSTLLWIDADRLEDVGRMTDQDKLGLQRDIVRNERRQGYENRPYGMVHLRIQELMYPVGHPYHTPVIGNHGDLIAATVADVKEFFATYYVPNNLSLCVAGHFDRDRVKPLIAELFGTLPSGAEPPHRTAAPAKLDRVVRATLLDRVQLARTRIVYHSPARFADGDAEMDLAAAVLCQGTSSRLYKRLVYEDKTAVAVDAYRNSEELGSLFEIEVTAQPGASLEAIEAAVDEEMGRLVERGPGAAELEQRKATIELDKLSAMEDIAQVAYMLNLYERYFGEPNSFKRDLDRYRKATAEGVHEWCRKVFTPDARAIVRVLPEQRATTQTARDTRPAESEAAAFRPQAPETFQLGNGMPVMLWRKNELPMVTLLMVFRTGSPLTEPSKAGLPSLTTKMLGEGAGDLDAIQFSDAMQSLGARFQSYAGHDSLHVSLVVLKRNLERAAGLMADAVRRPRLDPKEWDRVKRVHYEELKRRSDDPHVLSRLVGRRMLFGEANPYGRPPDGTLETVAALTLEDVRSEHRLLLRPDYGTVLVVGDITAAEVKPLLERVFGDWQMEAAAKLPEAKLEVPAHDGLRVAIVDRPDAVQTVIALVLPGTKRADPRRVQHILLNTVFGGCFTSRLNQNLREEHGYTYGAGSTFGMWAFLGDFEASSSVQADKTGPCVAELLKELRAIRKGDVKDEELAKARESYRTDIAREFEQQGSLLAGAAARIAAGLSVDTIAADLADLDSVTTGGVNGLVAAALPLEKGVLVLVGDKKRIVPQLSKLDLPAPVEVDAQGHLPSELSEKPR